MGSALGSARGNSSSRGASNQGIAGTGFSSKPPPAAAFSSMAGAGYSPSGSVKSKHTPTTMGRKNSFSMNEPKMMMPPKPMGAATTISGAPPKPKPMAPPQATFSMKTSDYTAGNKKNVPKRPDILNM